MILKYNISILDGDPKTATRGDNLAQVKEKGIQSVLQAFILRNWKK